MKTVDNMAGVLFAKEGYYKGNKVIVTHRDPATGNVWLEDYPVSGSPIVYGCWVDADSVRYQDEAKDNNQPKKRNKKSRRYHKQHVEQNIK